MKTSYFANVKNLPADAVPVCIARFNRFFKGRRYLDLAPTADMLNMSQEDYDKAFHAILAKLDPHKVAADLGPNAVLLCYERPGEICHRRLVAEWLEAALGIEIPEFGFDRAACPAYKNLVPSPPKPNKSAGKPKGPTQLFLF